MKFLKHIIPVVTIFLLVVSCGSKGSDDQPEPNISFDVKGLLTNVATNMVLPSYQNFQSTIEDVKTKATAFTSSSDQVTLDALKVAVQIATSDWQKMGLFEGGSGSRFGPSNTTYLRRFVNTFPTKPIQIENAIISSDYNLDTNFVIQGLPALDYLLYASDDASIIAAFSSDTDATKRQDYLHIIIDKMSAKTALLVSDWDTYKTTFSDNDNAGSNGSFSKLLNGVTEYYEQQMRKAKLAGPLGKFTSGEARPQDIESLYRKNSKQLLLEANQAIIDFYEGKYFGAVTKGKSLKDYLVASEVKSMGSSTLLSDDFSSKLASVQQKINAINGDYYTLVETKDASLDELFDAFQDAIALLKVEIFAALNTSISYSDNDGD